MQSATKEPSKNGPPELPSGETQLEAQDGNAQPKAPSRNRQPKVPSGKALPKTSSGNESLELPSGDAQAQALGENKPLEVPGGNAQVYVPGQDIRPTPAARGSRRSRIIAGLAAALLITMTAVLIIVLWNKDDSAAAGKTTMQNNADESTTISHVEASSTTSKVDASMMSSTTSKLDASMMPSTTLKRDATTKRLGSTDKTGIFSTAAVSTDVAECAQVGREILLEGGSAVDAAIATTLCGGLHHPHSSGIGGGSIMTIYNETSKQDEVIDFLETSSSVSYGETFPTNESYATYGGLSILIPGEIAGYFASWKKYGSVPWQRLFNRTIQMCEAGVIVSNYTAINIAAFSSLLSENEAFRDEFFADGRPLRAGEMMHRRRLCRTLRRVAEEPESFYKGGLADDVLSDVMSLGGNWTYVDLPSYAVRFRRALRFHLTSGDFVLITTPPPTVGVLLGYLLKVLNGYMFTPASLSDDPADVLNTSLTLHRIVEAFKFAFAQKLDLGDMPSPDFEPILENLKDLDVAKQVRDRIMDRETYNYTMFYYMNAKVTPPSFFLKGGGRNKRSASAKGNTRETGTLHTSVVDGSGQAVAITSTIHSEFGSKKMGNRTGVIFNNAMVNFLYGRSKSPSSTANIIGPNKRPLTDMCPSIVIDPADKIRIVVGAGGGPRIVTANAWTILNNLAFGLSPSASVNRPRLHNQLLPDVVNYEEGIRQEFLDGLRARKHVLSMYSGQQAGHVAAIAREGGQWHAVADRRSSGGTAGY